MNEIDFDSSVGLENGPIDCEADRPGHSFRSLADITARKLSWVWPGLIPRGKVTLLIGEAGVGKSLFSMTVAAFVSRGGSVPAACLPPGYLEEKDFENTPAGAVVIFSSEDDVADTTRPRLEAANADLNQIYVLTADGDSSAEQQKTSGTSAVERRSFQLERDLPVLEAHLRQLHAADVNVRLIVIDSIDEGWDSSDANGPFAATGADRLAELAAWSQAAVVVVANSKSDGISRAEKQKLMPGQQRLARAARSVLMIVRDLENEFRRVLIPVKLNLFGDWRGFAFMIRNRSIEWISNITPLSTDEYFFQAREKQKNPIICLQIGEFERVTQWLKQRLSRGPVKSIELQSDAYENEIGQITLRRAFRALGGIAERDYLEKRWYWRLPGRPNYEDHPESQIGDPVGDQ